MTRRFPLMLLFLVLLAGCSGPKPEDPFAGEGDVFDSLGQQVHELKIEMKQVRDDLREVPLSEFEADLTRLDAARDKLRTLVEELDGLDRERLLIALRAKALFDGDEPFSNDPMADVWASAAGFDCAPREPEMLFDALTDAESYAFKTINYSTTTLAGAVTRVDDYDERTRAEILRVRSAIERVRAAFTAVPAFGLKPAARSPDEQRRIIEERRVLLRHQYATAVYEKSRYTWPIDRIAEALHDEEYWWRWATSEAFYEGSRLRLDPARCRSHEERKALFREFRWLVSGSGDDRVIDRLRDRDPFRIEGDRVTLDETALDRDFPWPGTKGQLLRLSERFLTRAEAERLNAPLPPAPARGGRR